MYLEILKTMTFKHTFLCPKVSQKLHFFTISLQIFKDLTFSILQCRKTTWLLYFCFLFSWWCFGFGEIYPNEKYELKRNLCTKKKKKMVEASVSALGHRKWDGPVQTHFFKIKIKKPNPYNLGMMNHLIANTSRFYIPKLHQSVVLQVRA